MVQLGLAPGLLTDMLIFLYMCCEVRLMEEDIVGLEEGNEEERKAPIISWIPTTLLALCVHQLFKSIHIHI